MKVRPEFCQPEVTVVQQNPDLRKRNIRTGLILLSVALVFGLGFAANIILLGGK